MDELPTFEIGRFSHPTKNKRKIILEKRMDLKSAVFKPYLTKSIFSVFLIPPNSSVQR